MTAARGDAGEQSKQVRAWHDKGVAADDEGDVVDTARMPAAMLKLI